MKGNMKVLVSFMGGIICTVIVGLISWKLLPIPNAGKCSIVLACFNIFPFTAVTNGLIKKSVPVVMSGLGGAILLSTFIILLANFSSGYKASYFETIILILANTLGMFIMIWGLFKDIRNLKEAKENLNIAQQENTSIE